MSRGKRRSGKPKFKYLSKIHDEKMKIIGWSTDEAYLEVEKLVTESSCSEEETRVCDT
jgi:hypothetical protein